jgi:hypothetical protein
MVAEKKEIIMSKNFDYDDLSKEEKAHIISEYSSIDTEEMTVDMLNDVYGSVEVAGYKYDTGNLLKEIDEIAFREAMNNYVDSQITDGDIVEIDDEYYHKRDVDAALETLG